MYIFGFFKTFDSPPVCRPTHRLTDTGKVAKELIVFSQKQTDCQHGGKSRYRIKRDRSSLEYGSLAHLHSKRTCNDVTHLEKVVCDYVWTSVEHLLAAAG